MDGCVCVRRGVRARERERARVRVQVRGRVRVSVCEVYVCHLTPTTIRVLLPLVATTWPAPVLLASMARPWRVVGVF